MTIFDDACYRWRTCPESTFTSKVCSDDCIAEKVCPKYNNK